MGKGRKWHIEKTQAGHVKNQVLKLINELDFLSSTEAQLELCEL